jgi:hypothetical protein
MNATVDQNRYGRTKRRGQQPEKDRQNRTGRTGQTEMERQNRTKLERHKINRTGVPKGGCEDKTARIRQQGQDIQERTERRGLQVQDTRTGQAEYTRLP